jgi:hypothetical protein
MRKVLLFIFACLLLSFSTPAQTYAPFQGVGSVQFFSNSGVPLTSGVLYVYQAGTTTQVASYTDYTGTVQNPNPVPFTAGARATIWLTVGSYYKLVLCLQNDGPFCATSDVLYSIDQLPGGASSSSSGGSSPFISSSSNPATAGILRLASADTICWRNAANTTNLCFRKSSNDLLSWDGSSFGFTEITSIAAQCATGIDLQWADNAAHRWMQCNNGGTAAQFVASGVDINTSDQVTQLHFGATAIPLGAAPTTGQFFEWNGTQMVGATIPAVQTVYNTTTTEAAASVPATTMATAGASDQNYLFTLYIVQTVATAGCSGQPAVTAQLIYTDAATNASRSIPLPMFPGISTFGTNGTITFSATLGAQNTASVAWQLRAKSGTIVQYQTTYATGSGCGTGASYMAAPVLIQE